MTKSIVKQNRIKEHLDNLRFLNGLIEDLNLKMELAYIDQKRLFKKDENTKLLSDSFNTFTEVKNNMATLYYSVNTYYETIKRKENKNDNT